MPNTRKNLDRTSGSLVAAETPRVTADLMRLSLDFHTIRKQVLIHASTLPKLTATSAAYWENMRVVGLGPKHCEDLGHTFYILGEVQDWLLANGFLDSEASDD